MQGTRFARQLILGLVGCGVLTLVVQGGCAESEDIQGVALPGTGGSPTGGSQATGGSQGSGTGGTTQTGGSTGSGGVVATGGITGTGGTRATGGTVGTGGVVATGGTQGIGGNHATGGMIGTGGTGPMGGAVGTGGAGGGGATFTQVYQMVLSVSCKGSSCHSPGTQGGLNFSSQSSAYTTASNKVAAGNPNASTLFTEVNTGKMPRGMPKLPAPMINLINAWIKAGALNN